MATWQEILNAEMAARHWTQAELARRARVSANTLSNVMTGATSPQPQTVERLAEALHLTAGELYARQTGAPAPDPMTGSGVGQVSAHAPTVAYLQQLQNLLDMMPEEERMAIVADARRRALKWLMDDEVRPSHGAVG
jgi:transcriptional regulator with XRE-family HTH domain